MKPHRFLYNFHEKNKVNAQRLVDDDDNNDDDDDDDNSGNFDKGDNGCLANISASIRKSHQKMLQSSKKSSFNEFFCPTERPSMTGKLRGRD